MNESFLFVEIVTIKIATKRAFQIALHRMQRGILIIAAAWKNCDAMKFQQR